MSRKTNRKHSLIFISILLGAIILMSSLFAFSFAHAETIVLEPPIDPTTVHELAAKIQSYLLGIVGGIAIVAIAISGILYILGGSSSNEKMINMAKKGVFGSIAGLAIIMGADMILSEVFYIVLGKELDFNSLSASQILVRIINFLLAIVGTLFLISMIIGGIWYFAASADESKIELGKKTVRYSIVGITIALAAMVIIRQINELITGTSG